MQGVRSVLQHVKWYYRRLTCVLSEGGEITREAAANRVCKRQKCIIEVKMAWMAGQRDVFKMFTATIIPITDLTTELLYRTDFSRNCTTPCKDGFFIRKAFPRISLYTFIRIYTHPATMKQTQVPFHEYMYIYYQIIYTRTFTPHNSLTFKSLVKLKNTSSTKPVGVYFKM